MRRNKNELAIEQEKEYGFYNYCIFSVKERKENPDILVIELAPARENSDYYSKHINIKKQDIFDFIKAILPEFDLRMEKRALDLIEEKGLLKVLNASLVGRCFIAREDIKSYLQYTNGAIAPDAITCIDLEGKIYAENGGKYFKKFPKFNELYPSENSI